MVKYSAFFRSPFFEGVVMMITPCNGKCCGRTVVDTGLRKKLGGFARPIIRISPNGEEATFKSISEGARQSGCGVGNVLSACRGIGLTTNGYRWRYVDQSTPPRPPNNNDEKEPPKPVSDDDPIWAELFGKEIPEELRVSDEDVFWATLEMENQDTGLTLEDIDQGAGPMPA